MEKPAPASPAQACSACGAAFECGMVAGKSQCWCTELPPVMPMKNTAAGCLCRRCLEAEIERRLDRGRPQGAKGD